MKNIDIYLWKKYLNFSNRLLSKATTNKYLNNHFFANPTKPDKKILNLLFKLNKINLIYKCKLKIKFFYNILSLLSKVFYTSFIFNKEDLDKICSTQNFDLAIVSHLNNIDQLKSKEDPYFGNIIDSLTKKNVRVILILIPHCVYNKKIIEVFRRENKNINLYILNENLITFRKAIKELKSLIKERLLLLEISKTKKGFSKNLHLFTAETLISEDNQKNIIYASQLSEIVSSTNLKNIIMTFEGHSWEKIFFASSRISNPKIKCFGYQHTLIFKNDYYFKRPFNKFYDPEVIFCSGIKTSLIFSNIFKNKINIINVGTPKNSNKLKTLKVNYKNKKAILFLPSGDESEANLMTRFAYEFAKSNPQKHIIIRYHPLINKEFSKNYKNSLTNLEISESNIINDCKSSKWAIYLSSTSIFEAIQNGCYPIKFEYKISNLSNDPLWQIKSPLILKCKSHFDLYRIIRNPNYKKKNQIKLFNSLLNDLKLIRGKFNQRRIFNALNL